MTRGEHVRGRTLEAVLCAAIDVGAPGDCWLWRRSVTPNGYGKLGIGGKTFGAHRVVCELAHGPAPRGAEAMHSCDVRRCCNPAHLRWGSRSENVADMHRKGRASQVRAHGERSARAKLAEADVRQILASREPAAVLAARFGVRAATVREIRAGRSWAHLRPEWPTRRRLNRPQDGQPD